MSELTEKEKAEMEKRKLVQECRQILAKIENHRYFLRLLTNARDSLLMIANYKSNRRRN